MPNQALQQNRDDVLRCGESVGCDLLKAAVPPLLLREAEVIAPMVELLIEVAVWLVWLAARGVVLVLVSLPYGAAAGILARDVSPAAVIWQAIARAGFIILVHPGFLWVGVANLPSHSWNLPRHLQPQILFGPPLPSPYGPPWRGGKLTQSPVSPTKFPEGPKP